MSKQGEKLEENLVWDLEYTSVQFTFKRSILTFFFLQIKPKYSNYAIKCIFK